MVLSISAPLFASATSITDGKYNITATRSGSKSSHLVSSESGSFPMGSGTHTYKVNSAALRGTVTGGSFSSYWTGTGSNSGSYTCTAATTTRTGGKTVSA